MDQKSLSLLLCRFDDPHLRCALTTVYRALLKSQKKYHSYRDFQSDLKECGISISLTASRKCFSAFREDFPERFYSLAHIKSFAVVGGHKDSQQRDIKIAREAIQ